MRGKTIGTAEAKSRDMSSDKKPSSRSRSIPGKKCVGKKNPNKVKTKNAQVMCSFSDSTMLSREDPTIHTSESNCRCTVAISNLNKWHDFLPLTESFVDTLTKQPTAADSEHNITRYAARMDFRAPLKTSGPSRVQTRNVNTDTNDYEPVADEKQEQQQLQQKHADSEEYRRGVSDMTWKQHQRASKKKSSGGSFKSARCEGEGETSGLSARGKGKGGKCGSGAAENKIRFEKNQGKAEEQTGCREAPPSQQPSPKSKLEKSKGKAGECACSREATPQSCSPSKKKKKSKRVYEESEASLAESENSASYTAEGGNAEQAGTKLSRLLHFQMNNETKAEPVIVIKGSLDNPVLGQGFIEMLHQQSKALQKHLDSHKSDSPEGKGPESDDATSPELAKDIQSIYRRLSSLGSKKNKVRTIYVQPERDLDTDEENWLVSQILSQLSPTFSRCYSDLNPQSKTGDPHVMPTKRSKSNLTESKCRKCMPQYSSSSFDVEAGSKDSSDSKPAFYSRGKHERGFGTTADALKPCSPSVGRKTPDRYRDITYSELAYPERWKPKDCEKETAPLLQVRYNAPTRWGARPAFRGTSMVAKKAKLSCISAKGYKDVSGGKPFDPLKTRKQPAPTPVPEKKPENTAPKNSDVCYKCKPSTHGKTSENPGGRPSSRADDLPTKKADNKSKHKKSAISKNKKVLFQQRCNGLRSLHVDKTEALYAALENADKHTPASEETLTRTEQRTDVKSAPNDIVQPEVKEDDDRSLTKEDRHMENSSRRDQKAANKTACLQQEREVVDRDDRNSGSQEPNSPQKKAPHPQGITESGSKGQGLETVKTYCVPEPPPPPVLKRTTTPITPDTRRTDKAGGYQRAPRQLSPVSQSRIAELKEKLDLEKLFRQSLNAKPGPPFTSVNEGTKSKEVRRTEGDESLQGEPVTDQIDKLINEISLEDTLIQYLTKKVDEIFPVRRVRKEESPHRSLDKHGSAQPSRVAEIRDKLELDKIFAQTLDQRFRKTPPLSSAMMRKYDPGLGAEHELSPSEQGRHSVPINQTHAAPPAYPSPGAHESAHTRNTAYTQTSSVVNSEQVSNIDAKPPVDPQRALGSCQRCPIGDNKDICRPEHLKAMPEPGSKYVEALSRRDAAAFVGDFVNLDPGARYPNMKNGAVCQTDMSHTQEQSETSPKPANDRFERPQVAPKPWRVTPEAAGHYARFLGNPEEVIYEHVTAEDDASLRKNLYRDDGHDSQFRAAVAAAAAKHLGCTRTEKICNKNNPGLDRSENVDCVSLNDFEKRGRGGNPSISNHTFTASNLRNILTLGDWYEQAESRLYSPCYSIHKSCAAKQNKHERCGSSSEKADSMQSDQWESTDTPGAPQHNNPMAFAADYSATMRKPFTVNNNKSTDLPRGGNNEVLVRRFRANVHSSSEDTLLSSEESANHMPLRSASLSDSSCASCESGSRAASERNRSATSLTVQATQNPPMPRLRTGTGQGHVNEVEERKFLIKERDNREKVFLRSYMLCRILQALKNHTLLDKVTQQCPPSSGARPASNSPYNPLAGPADEKGHTCGKAKHDRLTGSHKKHRKIGPFISATVRRHNFPSGHQLQLHGVTCCRQAIPDASCKLRHPRSGYWKDLCMENFNPNDETHQFAVRFCRENSTNNMGNISDREEARHDPTAPDTSSRRICLSTEGTRSAPAAMSHECSSMKDEATKKLAFTPYEPTDSTPVLQEKHSAAGLAETDHSVILVQTGSKTQLRCCESYVIQDIGSALPLLDKQQLDTSVPGAEPDQTEESGYVHAFDYDGAEPPDQINQSTYLNTPARNVSQNPSYIQETEILLKGAYTLNAEYLNPELPPGPDKFGKQLTRWAGGDQGVTLLRMQSEPLLGKGALSSGSERSQEESLKPENLTMSVNSEPVLSSACPCRYKPMFPSTCSCHYEGDISYDNAEEDHASAHQPEWKRRANFLLVGGSLGEHQIVHLPDLLITYWMDALPVTVNNVHGCSSGEGACVKKFSPGGMTVVGTQDAPLDLSLKKKPDNQPPAPGDTPKLEGQPLLNSDAAAPPLAQDLPDPLVPSTFASSTTVKEPVICQRENTFTSSAGTAARLLCLPDYTASHGTFHSTPQLTDTCTLDKRLTHSELHNEPLYPACWCHPSHILPSPLHGPDRASFGEAGAVYVSENVTSGDSSKNFSPEQKTDSLNYDGMSYQSFPSMFSTMAAPILISSPDQARSVNGELTIIPTSTPDDSEATSQVLYGPAVEAVPKRSAQPLTLSSEPREFPCTLKYWETWRATHPSVQPCTGLADWTIHQGHQDGRHVPASESTSNPSSELSSSLYQSLVKGKFIFDEKSVRIMMNEGKLEEKLNEAARGNQPTSLAELDDRRTRDPAENSQNAGAVDLLPRESDPQEEKVGFVCAGKVSDTNFDSGSDQRASPDQNCRVISWASRYLNPGPDAMITREESPQENIKETMKNQMCLSSLHASPRDDESVADNTSDQVSDTQESYIEEFDLPAEVNEPLLLPSVSESIVSPEYLTPECAPSGAPDIESSGVAKSGPSHQGSPVGKITAPPQPSRSFVCLDVIDSSSQADSFHSCSSLLSELFWPVCSQPSGQ